MRRKDDGMSADTRLEELGVNGLADWLGYYDGEISGMVAHPALAG